MKHARPIVRLLALVAGVTAGLNATAGSASAQLSTRVFHFEDLHIDTGASGGPTSLMTGTFEWAYTPGDFENGTGTFTDLYIPGHGSNIGELVITVEPSQIEFSLDANLHDHGVDVSVKLLQPFSPTQPALVDTVLSKYQYESGVITNGVFVSGSVVPQADIVDLCFGDGTGTACPCGNAGDAGEGCANSAGEGALLSASGSTSVGADDIAFQMIQGPGPSPALLFVGAQQVNGCNGAVFGDGLRCAGGAIQRLDVRILDSAGSANWAAGLSVQGGWSAGDVRVFQTWYRDVSGSPCGGQFNTSQALAVTFQP